MNGNEVLKALKNIRKEVYVILISGYSDQEIRNFALLGGAYDFITKPLDI